MSRNIFLAQPGYGHPTAASARSFWRACKDTAGLNWSCEIGSLLAANFNKTWCSALNIVHQGEKVDYFAMLHDDIASSDGWLDDLIDEMEAHDLDVLGVVSPIKDTRGMTSMALHDEQRGNWMPYARLSMHDVYSLPETFTSDDVGHPILLNTGCWVCKFDEWAKYVHFTINDRIVFNTAADAYQSQTEPEDWCFSRMLHEIGRPGSATEHLKPLRIGATRKIPLLHRGELDFHNTAPWGTHTFDSEAIGTSPVSTAFPHEIPGWLSPEEGQKLAELANGKRVLEIGSYCGRSTICIARTAQKVDAVDYFDGRGTPRPADTSEQFWANIERYGLMDKVESYHPDDIPHFEYDMAFIDGSHEKPDVQSDIRKCLPKLASGGFLVFHDYDEPCQPGVTEAVEELLAAGGELETVTEHLAVVKPAEVLLEV